MTPDPRAALRTHFGFDDFRPGQAEAVEAALAGRDALVVMPTGSGKSLCYQLPALLQNDLVVVVSPLVSLMQDQVDGLQAVAGDRVALVNAQQGAAANRDALRRAAAGELRLLYVAPERFASPGFLAGLKEAGIGLFVVDEAHCVSQWGHDFRPDYFRLADAARWLGARAIMATTATATPSVARDIERRLGLRDPVRVTTGFDRPNLSFLVVPSRSAADKRRRLVSALADPAARPAIVYAGTRAACEKLAGDISGSLGIEAIAYHAGLGREERAEAQRRFMAGEAPVVVATNAFGMGVDKADVRTVVHAAVPSSVEAYYQEAGRAGRDGAPARCLLLAEPRDKGLHVYFIQRSEVNEHDFHRAVRALARGAADGRYDVPLADVAPDGDEDRARALLGHLARAGVLTPVPAPPDRAAGRIDRAWDGRALADARGSAAEAQRVRWSQYRAVWQWVERASCRRRGLLRHFGDRSEPPPGPVPCCDVCAPDAVPVPAGTRSTGAAAANGADDGTLDDAILTIVSAAEPAVGRTRAVEILRGGRSKVVAKHSYDGLPGYGAYAHLGAEEVLARVDALVERGTLRSTGGRFPKLATAAA
jgi:ATP-dependent DNA helicase RecQ